MVCDPFSYSKFIEMKNVVQKLLIGFGICFLLACDNFIYIIAAHIVLRHPNKYLSFEATEITLYLKISRSVEIFHFTKLILLKLLFAGAIIFMAHNTRMAFKESSDVAGAQSQAKHAAHKRIFYFTLIPLFINLVFLIPELMNEIFPAPQASFLIKL